ncbi:MAG: zinc ribbon domain-containing protein [Adlercreutzia sp.]|nr:zinc ribbon domain-containing protein [Adlercreutzia sp.]
MICPSCQKAIPDDSAFCEECGAPIEPSPHQAPTPAEPIILPTPAKPADPVAPSQEKSKGTLRLFSSIGIVAGILCIAAGIFGFVALPGTPNSGSFGGDFYTYTYQGIVALSKQLDIVARLACGALASFGVFLVCHFGLLLNQRS